MKVLPQLLLGMDIFFSRSPPPPPPAERISLRAGAASRHFATPNTNKTPWRRPCIHVLGKEII